MQFSPKFLQRDFGLAEEGFSPRTSSWIVAARSSTRVMDRYADFPPFTRAEAARLRRRWLSAGRQRTSLLIAPAVLDVVGRKPRRRA